MRVRVRVRARVLVRVLVRVRVCVGGGLRSRIGRSASPQVGLVGGGVLAHLQGLKR